VPKALTRDQLEARKEKAVRFVETVLGDPERADEIADESLEDYAARRKIEILDNPRRQRRTKAMPTNRELQQRVRELEEENEELQEQLDAVADIVAPADEEDEDEADDTAEDDDQD